MPDLIPLACVITTPTGTLALEHEIAGYKLESSTAGERQVTKRKKTVKNDLVEGQFTISALRENVVETLAVWVTGATPAQLRTRLNALTDALDQVQYSLVFTDQDSTETWTCEGSDYVIRTNTELRHARKALVVAQVERRPTVVYS